MGGASCCRRIHVFRRDQLPVKGGGDKQTPTHETRSVQPTTQRMPAGRCRRLPTRRAKIRRRVQAVNWKNKGRTRRVKWHEMQVNVVTTLSAGAPETGTENFIFTGFFASARQGVRSPRAKVLSPRGRRFQARKIVRGATLAPHAPPTIGIGAAGWGRRVTERNAGLHGCEKHEFPLTLDLRIGLVINGRFGWK